MLARALRRVAGHVALPACLLTLTLAAPATAATADARFPADGEAMKAALDVAVSYWGKAPCAGQFAATWVDLPVTDNAISRWLTFQVDPYAAPEQNTDCRIDFNRRAPYDWPMLCSVAVHEVGHLLGHDHTAERGHVMHDTYSGPVKMCLEAAAARGDLPASSATRSTTRSRRARSARRRAALRARLLARRPRAQLQAARG